MHTVLCVLLHIHVFIENVFPSQNSIFFNTTDIADFALDDENGRGTEELGAGIIGGQSMLDPTSAYLLESLGYKSYQYTCIVILCTFLTLIFHMNDNTCNIVYL